MFYSYFISRYLFVPPFCLFHIPNSITIDIPTIPHLTKLKTRIHSLLYLFQLLNQIVALPKPPPPYEFITFLSVRKKTLSPQPFSRGD